MAEQRFVVFDPEDGPEWFDTADAAEAHAETILEAERDLSADGWSEEVTGICWGEFVCLGEVVQTKCEKAEEGSEFDEWWDFDLKSTPSQQSEVARLTEELSSIRSATRIRVTAEEPPTRGGRVIVWDRRQNHGEGDWVIYIGNMVAELPAVYTHWLPLPGRPGQ